jgi:hypothetical protein
MHLSLLPFFWKNVRARKGRNLKRRYSQQQGTIEAERVCMRIHGRTPRCF